MNNIENMSKRNRGINAMRGLPVDRVPVYFYPHFPIHNSDNNVDDYVNWCRRSGTDMMLIQTDGFWGYPIDKTTRDINNIAEIKAMPKHHNWIESQVDRVKRISDALQGDVATFHLMYTPFAIIKHIYCHHFDPKLRFSSTDDIMIGWKKNWPILYDAMKYIEDANNVLMDRLKEETVCDGLFLTFQFADKVRWSAEDYVERLAEWDKRLLAKANSLYEDVVCHVCSYEGLPNHIEVWKDYDYKTMNWAVHIEHMSLAEGRKLWKPGTTIMGGFDKRPQSILYNGTKQELKDYTKALIKEAGQERFIISADCSVSHDLTDERLHWVVEAAEEYAQGIV